MRKEFESESPCENILKYHERIAVFVFASSSKEVSDQSIQFIFISTKQRDLEIIILLRSWNAKTCQGQGHAGEAAGVACSAWPAKQQVSTLLKN